MSSIIHDVADQIKADERTRRSLQIMTANLNDKAQKTILWSYEDPELRDIYNALRDINHTSKDKTRRRVIKFPNQYVFNFLNDTFTPIYGSNWLSDVRTLKKVIKKEQDLIRPWVIGNI